MQNREYDVVVAGLGTAGAIALLQCARLGLKTLGLERMNQMGGTGTAGGIGAYYYGSSGGIYEEVNKRAAEMQADYFHMNGYAIPAAKAVMLERMAKEAGAEFVYNAVITEVLQEENTVRGVSYVDLENGETICVQAKVVIDATGEGEIGQMCGCAFRCGRDFDGETQPYTNSVFIADPAARIENKDAGHICMQDNAAMSKELLRANTLPIYLQDSYPKQKVFLANAPLPGVREGTLLKGKQTVTAQGALSGQTWENTVFYAYSNIDKHGKDVAFEDKMLKDWYLCAGLWGVNLSVAIPMGTFLPRDVDGLLVGGRALSVDHDISSCVRMKSDMEKCGEVMADMAFLAVKHDCALKDVPYAELKSMLEETGCLDEKNNVGFYNRTPNGMVPVIWPKNTEELKRDLSGDRSGFGIWAVTGMPDSVREDLCAWLPEGGVLAQNSAIALGLLWDLRALPKLREMAKARDMRVPKTSIKFAQTVGVTAVYLLGKLGDTESVSILEQIIADDGAFDEAAFRQDEMYATPADVSFQLISNAAAALCDIAQQHEELRKEITDFLQEKMIQNKELFVPLTMKGNGSVLNMAEKIREYAAKMLKTEVK